MKRILIPPDSKNKKEKLGQKVLQIIIMLRERC